MASRVLIIIGIIAIVIAIFIAIVMLVLAAINDWFKEWYTWVVMFLAIIIGIVGVILVIVGGIMHRKKSKNAVNLTTTKSTKGQGKGQMTTKNCIENHISSVDIDNLKSNCDKGVIQSAYNNAEGCKNLGNEMCEHADDIIKEREARRAKNLNNSRTSAPPNVNISQSSSSTKGAVRSRTPPENF